MQLGLFLCCGWIAPAGVAHHQLGFKLDLVLPLPDKLMFPFFHGEKLLEKNLGRNASKVFDWLLDDADRWPQRRCQLKVVKAKQRNRFRNRNSQFLQRFKCINRCAVLECKDSVGWL